MNKEKDKRSETDHARLDAMTDEVLRANALSDPDNPPLEDDFFETAKTMRIEDLIRKPKKIVTLRLDADTLDWFRRQGKGYQSRINAVLKAYKEAVRDRESNGA